MIIKKMKKTFTRTMIQGRKNKPIFTAASLAFQPANKAGTGRWGFCGTRKK